MEPDLWQQVAELNVRLYYVIGEWLKHTGKPSDLLDAAMAHSTGEQFVVQFRQWTQEEFPGLYQRVTAFDERNSDEVGCSFTAAVQDYGDMRNVASEELTDLDIEEMRTAQA